MRSELRVKTEIAELEGWVGGGGRGVKPTAEQPLGLINRALQAIYLGNGKHLSVYLI